MHQPNTKLRLGLLLASSSLLSSCANNTGDTERYSELERLRVLAVRSAPADIAPGETATLSALVFEPADRDIEYEWSWCPSRGDDSGGFSCSIAEDDLRNAWQQAGNEEELPSYDLGHDVEAMFTHVFSLPKFAATCAALTASEAEPEKAALNCLFGLQVSVQLKVRTSEGEVTAVKDLVLLMEATPAEQRNTNPELSEAFVVKDMAEKRELDSEEPLVAGHKYSLATEVSDDVAELVQADGSAEKPHRETLIMAWFTTVGHTVSIDSLEGGFGGDDDRTTFVDGRNELDAVKANGLELPLTAGPEDGQVIVVLRDERGGVGWASHRFHVKESK